MLIFNSELGAKLTLDFGGIFFHKVTCNKQILGYIYKSAVLF